MPRPRKQADVLQAAVPPEQRGYVPIRLRTDALDALDAYVADHGLKGRSAAVIKLLEGDGPPPTPQAPSPPWSAIRDSLLQEFGFVAKNRIDETLRRAGWTGDE